MEGRMVLVGIILALVCIYLLVGVAVGLIAATAYEEKFDARYVIVWLPRLITGKKLSRRG